MGTSGEFPIGCSACHSDTFIEHMLCAEDTGDLTLYLERPTGTITMPQILWLEWKVVQPTTAGMRGVAQGEGAWTESGRVRAPGPPAPLASDCGSLSRRWKGWSARILSSLPAQMVYNCTIPLGKQVKKIPLV